MTDLVVPVPLPPQLARLRNYAGPPAPAGVEARPWFEFRNAANDGDQGDTAELLVYDEIGDGGWFGGGVSAASFADALRQVTAPNLTVRLNSPGGDVFDGIAVANQLRAHPSNVTVVVDGIAASIASVIAMAGDKIVMAPQSQMMIHDAMGSTWGGNPADHRAMADLLDRQSDNIAAAYRQKAGGMTKSWRTRMQAETWYTADEAVAAGLADSVGTVPTSTGPAPSTANPSSGYDDWWDRSTKTFDLAARYRFAGRAQAPSPDGLATTRAAVDDTARKTATAVPTEPLVINVSPDVALSVTVHDPAQTRAAAQQQAALDDTDEPAPPADSDQAPATANADTEPADISDQIDDTHVDAPAVPEPPLAAPDWAAATAHLLQDPADSWAAATAHLIGA